MEPVSPSSVLSSPSFTDREVVRLSFSFQTPSRRQAVQLVSQLGTMAADVAQKYPPSPRPPGQRDWIVVLTTPPVPLAVAVIQAWEGAMLAVEHRRPGCHFRGWRTCWTPARSIGSIERESGRDGTGARQRRSQRELVTASLLRCPPRERQGIVHGRGGPK
jgi:hypothetical protein